MQPRTVGGKDLRVEPNLPALKKFLLIWQQRALQLQSKWSLFRMQLSWAAIGLFTYWLSSSVDQTQNAENGSNRMAHLASAGPGRPRTMVLSIP